MGVKDIHIKMWNNYVWKIHKARHIPKLMCNLISIGWLDDERHNVTFTGGVWKVMKGVMVIAQWNKIGTLYMTSSCRDIWFMLLTVMLIQIFCIVSSNTWVKKEWKYSYQMVNCQGWHLLSTNYVGATFSKNQRR